MALQFNLKAKNSNGKHGLIFDADYHNEEIHVCLTGEYKGEAIQIDFDPISEDDLDDLIEYLNIKKGKMQSPISIR